MNGYFIAVLLLYASLQAGEKEKQIDEREGYMFILPAHQVKSDYQPGVTGILDITSFGTEVLVITRSFNEAILEFMDRESIEKSNDEN